MKTRLSSTGHRLPGIQLETLILLLGLLVRLWGLAQGLPDAVHPDESLVVRRALRFGSGDLNPHFFYYPSFSMYLFFLLDGVYFILGRFLGVFHTPMDIARSFTLDPTTVYMLARLASAIADALSALLIMRLGRNYFSREIGLLAGLLWAFFPHALRECQVAKPDSLMVFLALLSLVVLQNAQTIRRCALGGLCLGLAASAKYQAVAFGPAALLWTWQSPFSRGNLKSKVVFFFACAAFGFFIGVPFALLDWHHFFSDFMSQSEIMRLGLYGAEGGSKGWLLYLKVLINPEHSPFVALAALLGAWLGIRSNRRETAFIFTVLFTLFILLGNQRIASPHYFYLGFPFLFLLASRGMIGVWEATQRRKPLLKALAAVLFVAGFAPYCRGTFVHLRQVSGPDTRVLARQWIEDNIAPGSMILMDASAPALPMTREQLDELFKRAKAAGHIKADLFELQRKFQRGEGYRLFLTEQAVMLSPKSLVDYSRQVQELIPIDRGVAWVRSQGIKYVVVSETEANQYRSPEILVRYPQYAKFYSDLKAQTSLLAEFPADDKHPGPTIRIYGL